MKSFFWYDFTYLDKEDSSLSEAVESLLDHASISESFAVEEMESCRTSLEECLGDALDSESDVALICEYQLSEDDMYQLLIEGSTSKKPFQKLVFTRQGEEFKPFKLTAFL